MVVSPCWFFFQRKKKKSSLLLSSSSSIVLFYFIFLNSAGQPSARIQNEFFLSLFVLSHRFSCVTCLSSPSLYLSTEVTASGGFRLLFIYFIFIFVTFLCLFVPSPILLAYIATHTHQPHGKKPKIAVYGLCPALSIHYLVIFSLEQTVCHCTSKRHTGQIHVDVK